MQICKNFNVQSSNHSGENFKHYIDARDPPAKNLLLVQMSKRILKTLVTSFISKNLKSQIMVNGFPTFSLLYMWQGFIFQLDGRGLGNHVHK